MKDDLNEQELHQLRIGAEAKLARHSPSKATKVRPSVELLQELQVHKIELEMQKEELRRAQAALEESRDRYVELYEFAPVGYITLANSGLIAEANPTGAKLLRVGRNKLLHSRFDRFVAPEDRDRWRRLFTGVMRHGSGQELELLLQRGDSTAFHAHLDCRRMSFGDMQQAVRIAFTDIPEHRMAEDALQRYKQVIDTAMDGFWMTDELGDLQEANKAYAKMSGYSIDELVNMHISQLETKEQSREEVEAHAAKVITQGFGFFINSTVNFSSMLENPVFQTHRCHHERHRPLRTPSWTENALAGEVC